MRAGALFVVTAQDGAIKTLVSSGENMTNAHTMFRAAFAPYKATLEANGEAQIRRLFAEAVEVHGPTLSGVYNSARFGRVWSETIGRLTARDGNRMSGNVTLVDSRVAAHVAEWAAAELEGAVEKLAAKVGDLTDVTVVGANGGVWFTVKGTRADGANVCIDQSQILNVSSRGKLFNQWPARIYVNGKIVSEAAYKRAAA